MASRMPVGKHSARNKGRHRDATKHGQAKKEHRTKFSSIKQRRRKTIDW